MTDTNKTPNLAGLKANLASTAASNVAGTDKVQAPKAPILAPQIPEPQEKSYNVYYHTTDSCRVLTPTGRLIAFVGGKHITDNPEAIEYLESVIANGQSNISVIPGKEVMTTSELDPMVVLRKAHLAEFAALQKESARKIAAGEPLSQSESEVQRLLPGSTSDIAALAGDSSSVDAS